MEPDKLWSSVVAEQFENSLNHRVGVSQHLVVPKPNNAIAFGFEKACAAGIRCLLVGVLPAIEFDDEMPLKADEIDDERANWRLAAESASIQLSASQSCPQMALGMRRIGAQFPRSGSQHLRTVARAELAHSPPP